MRYRDHIAGRLAATLLVVFWVAQPVFAIAHAQEHAHRYCPAHRAFEEASASESTSVAEQAREALSFEQQPPAAPGSLLHEACAFVSASTREELPGPDEVQPAIQACLCVSPPATAPPRPHSSLSILDTAPKASPPAHV
jgi:hypothetical protein